MKSIEEFAQHHAELFNQEELILEATELVSKIMKDNEISKAELANRLGKTKAFVTQCLSGHQNLTLRTLADLLTALEYRASLGAEPASQACKAVHRLYPIKAWAVEVQRFDRTSLVDLSADATEIAEDTLCDAA